MPGRRTVCFILPRQGSLARKLLEGLAFVNDFRRDGQDEKWLAERKRKEVKKCAADPSAGLSTLLLHGHGKRAFANHGCELVIRHGYIHP